MSYYTQKIVMRYAHGDWAAWEVVSQGTNHALCLCESEADAQFIVKALDQLEAGAGT